VGGQILQADNKSSRRHWYSPSCDILRILGQGSTGIYGQGEMKGTVAGGEMTSLDEEAGIK
jgi:hypothetical protein